MAARPHHDCTARRRGFASRTQAAPATQATPACGGLACGHAPARQRGFSLLELVTVCAIVVMVMAIGFPLIHRQRASNRLLAARSDLVAALQSAPLLADERRAPDGDNAEPRLPRSRHTGIALAFDPGRDLALFLIHDQAAEDPTFPATDPRHRLARQTFNHAWPDGRVSIGITKMGYAPLPRTLPVRLDPRIGVFGLARDDRGTPLDAKDDTLILLPMPFAVCAKPGGLGLPPAPAIFADLRDDGQRAQLPTALPAILLFVKDDLTALGIDPQRLDGGPLAGMDDCRKVEWLTAGPVPRATLILLSARSGTELDTP